ncbi:MULTISPECIES: BppU family phage baseplate upper protein [Bacillus]|uniref:BppU N-terminal domain-containing protein n=2 Tax=Bacillus cereus TaxID=1396 RepID=A0A164FRY1_BACCE|nr:MULTISPECIES: BppU family phage baseplate upper protein [Bacillus]KZD36469.1 hypothetical protein B4082_2286 [Bacillus cereus]MCU4759393.1 BppU family phage baseplate upper protein [Bacillus cereus]MDF2016490.1 BppU family phage baseplate upper protein [Bacillus sp. Cr_R3]MDF2033744.1 BppU family phage baseplate upper protein [Bacillus sp. Cr_R16]
MAEILKIREITIDTMQHKEFNIKEEELKLIRFYQNDLNSAKLLINVTHDKVVTDFSSATSVQIAFLKPDCKRVFQDVQNVNQMQGKYYVVLSTQTLIAYGNVIAQLRFTFPNNKVIETCKFAFTVDESIMSDEAMKSTNEFPVIQKAIEAGKKLEGVDIDGIIAAGAKADGALPKTGGTMTGNLIFDKTPASGTSWRNLSWSLDGTEAFRWGLNGANNFMLWDAKNNVIPIEYRPATQELRLGGTGTTTIVRDSNVVKKTEIYSSLVKADGGCISISNTDLDNLKAPGFYSGYTLGNAPTGITGTLYVDVTMHTPTYIKQEATTATAPTIQKYTRELINNVWTPWQKLVREEDVYKKIEIYSNWVAPDGRSKSINDTDLNTVIDSGIYTGQRLTNAPENITNFFFYVEVLPYTNNSYRLQRATLLNHVSQRVWFRTLIAGNWQPWTEMTYNSKDGTTNLIITSDFTPTSGTVQNIVRRGNTVTLMLDVTRNADSTSPIVTTLPEGVRPIGSLTTDIASPDGTMSRLLIRFNGEVHLDTKGKRYRILQTFVTP